MVDPQMIDDTGEVIGELIHQGCVDGADGAVAGDVTAPVDVAVLDRSTADALSIRIN